ncbi:hypothetical protein DYH09_28485 [bacterium CPR1]|nr:hypothetical protein [bacterium CPR1]
MRMPWWTLVILAATWLCWPLLTRSNLPRASDLSYHAQYTRGFAEGWAQGRIYPRWVGDSNRGYGAPVFVIYGPVAPAAAALAGNGDLIRGLRRVAVVGSALAGLAFFLAARALGSDRGAAVGAAFYVLFPYHALDLYDRFALAELLAFVWLAPLFASVCLLARGPHRGARAVLVACLAGLVMTHVMTAYMVGLTLIPYAVWAVRGHWRRLIPMAGAMGAAALLCSVYLLPLLVERKELHLDWFQEDHYQYARSFVDRDPRSVGLQDDPTRPWCVRAAATTALVALAGLLVLGLKLDGPDREGRRCEGFAQAGLSFWALFLQTSWSAPLWAALPGLAEVQFPWRFGLLQSLSTAFLVACVTGGRSRLALAIVGLAALPALAVSARVTEARSWTADATLANTPAWRYRAVQEYIPRGVLGWREWHQRSIPGQRASLALPGQVEERFWSSHVRRLRVVTQQPNQLNLALFFYPGWTARVDGTPVAVGATPGDQTMLLDVPPGDHQVEVSFETTRERRLGLWVSLITLLALGAGFLRRTS